ncbi:MAG: AAA family ATPase [Oscillospiraceae bacterium]|nr:AAA family ATPase [Oscillospiraceae bacterium]
MMNVFDNDMIRSAVELTFTGVSAYRRDAYTAGSRFWRASCMLDAGFLGWQISADNSGEPSVTAFSDSDPVTSADLSWVFRNCADTQERSSVAPCDLFAGERRVYEIRPAERTAPEDGPERMDDGAREVLDMLAGTGGVMRFCAGTGENGEWRGAVFLSLKKTMTLRMRAALAEVLPGETFEEIDAGNAARWQMPSGLMREAVSCFLYELMIRAEKRRGDDEREEVPSFPDTGSDDFTPIEDLDLSLRSFNCLKRAGIHSVEQLRGMSEDDLRHVRNLGTKGVGEICRKLSETAPRTATTQMTESGMAELEGMVGLHEVKEQVRRIAAFAGLKRAMAKTGREHIPVVLNMEFIGNPGTAKTTVARALAGILSEIGILSDPELVEVGRADLVAGYVGQTAGKVRDVFERAKGRLLFIDEAYSLADGRSGDYGDEAISAIVQEMENAREDTVVIFAGYPDRMEELFSRNPGLRSRVPFTIRFPDYTAEEMAQITEIEAKKRGFAVSDEGKTRILSICREVWGSLEPGNGRFCRNLAENAILEYAARTCVNGEAVMEGEPVLTETDFGTPPVRKGPRQTVHIGFEL